MSSKASAIFQRLQLSKSDSLFDKADFQSSFEESITFQCLLITLKDPNSGWHFHWVCLQIPRYECSSSMFQYYAIAQLHRCDFSLSLHLNIIILSFVIILLHYIWLINALSKTIVNSNIWQVLEIFIWNGLWFFFPTRLLKWVRKNILCKITNSSSIYTLDS